MSTTEIPATQMIVDDPVDVSPIPQEPQNEDEVRRQEDAAIAKRAEAAEARKKKQFKPELPGGMSCEQAVALLAHVRSFIVLQTTSPGALYWVTMCENAYARQMQKSSYESSAKRAKTEANNKLQRDLRGPRA